MNNLDNLRRLLDAGGISIGSWIQLPYSKTALLMAKSGYDWIAVDLEHGSISIESLANLIDIINLANVIPLVRVFRKSYEDYRQVADAGAKGVIIADVTNGEQITEAYEAITYPPNGKRGIGFSSSNDYGMDFDTHVHNSTDPFIVAMIESIEAVKNIDNILNNKHLDAVLIGPYDLSSSLGDLGNFSGDEFNFSIEKIRFAAMKYSLPCGIHVVQPNPSLLSGYIKQGYRFLPYSIDSVMLRVCASRPEF